MTFCGTQASFIFVVGFLIVSQTIAFHSQAPMQTRTVLGKFKTHGIRLGLASPLFMMMSDATSAALAADPTQIRGSYDQLCEKLKDIERLSGIQSLLGWDEMTMMPAGGAGARAEMKAALAGVLHEKQVEPALGDLLAAFEGVDLGGAGLTAYEAANVRDAERAYRKETRKTKEMASREAELEARAYAGWAAAKAAGDFAAFAPFLRDLVALKTEVAGAVSPELGAYDANVDNFERGMTAARLGEIFAPVREGVAALLRDITARKQSCAAAAAAGEGLAPALRPVPEALRGGDRWDLKAQEALCRELSEAIGFDFGSGRMDVSLHPFTGGPHPTDVRITTRYSTENWKDGVTGAVHEVGHALYEQGRNKAHADLPVARALSMGVHESQSLLWERMVFLSRPFWDYATPIFHKHFPHTKDCTADDFYAVMNQVEPGFIRVDADEVTYPLHVVLRYELEKKLFDGSLDIEGVPEAWDAQMKELLGLEVDGPARGCLQDIHWSIGAFGYFPSYSLGAMMAAQIYAAAQRELPGLEDDIRQGQFAGLKTWLNEKVHQKGSLVASPDELLKEITGAALDPTIFLDYLRTKYTALYGL